METIVDFVKRRLVDAGRPRWRAIACAAGTSPKLPEKIVYGMRENPRVQTIQPLLDFFVALDRGEVEMPDPLPPEPVKDHAEVHR